MLYGCDSSRQNLQALLSLSDHLACAGNLLSQNADCDGGGATAGSGELEKNQLDKQELSV